MTIERGDDAFWAGDAASVLAALTTTPGGLSQAEAERRLEALGPNVTVRSARGGPLRLILAQLANPITLLLIGGSVLSIGVGESVDGSIILIVVLVSAVLGFWQEHRAAGAVERLMAMLHTTATVLRDGVAREVALSEVVPGDVVRLEAGAAVPGDGRILLAQDLHVDQAPLTGESFPVAKTADAVGESVALAARANAVWLGTHVVSGSATAVMVHTGKGTAFGALAGAVATAPEPTEFERGVRRFGALLMNVALVLGLVIFAINVAMGKPVLETLLFTLALVIGLTPQLLPAIVSVTLAHGAHYMAQVKVIVRRLSAIEDLGGMSVLCTDKTGTITEGVVAVHGAEDWEGAPSDRVRRCAALNAAFESGYRNPIDDALRRTPLADVAPWTKLGEVPYDFVRKRLSVAVSGPAVDGTGAAVTLITKGAVTDVLAACDRVETSTGQTVPIGDARAAVLARLEVLSAQGLRCLGVAWRALDGAATLDRDAESGMIFSGFLTVEDPLKATARASLDALARLGIRVAIVTGDNRFVAAHIAAGAGLDVSTVLTGADIHAMDEAALAVLAPKVSVFAEVEPNQKERVIRALKTGGRSVGYLGDGINDAAALHAADVGISVDTATDVTRQAADIVLLEKDLGVLVRGVEEGRRAFANTLKYVCITTSANFGNMISMAVGSIAVPFLPLLPPQVLVNNVLSDLPAMAIATDRLDPELVSEPRKWDTAAIRRFMIAFGLVSTVFDLATFAYLRWQHVAPATFRTAWFLESLLTELVILLVIRTRRAAFSSRPAAPLLWGTGGAVIVATVLVLWPPAAALLGFAPLSMPMLGVVLAIVATYGLASELTKRAMLGRTPL